MLCLVDPMRQVADHRRIFFLGEIWPSLAVPALVDQRWHMCLFQKTTRNTLIKHSIESRVMRVQCRSFGLSAHLLFAPSGKFLECFIVDAGDMHLSKERNKIFRKHDHIVTINLLTNTTF